METNKPAAITGLKKRQQISKANRLVFLWVAAAGVAVTIAIVLSQFMLKQFFFNNTVISTMTKTNDTLKKNAQAYEPLKTEIIKLIAAKELTDLRTSPNDSALQVVIDAMPTVDDRLALAASLQQVILSKSGVKIEQLSFADQSAVTSDPTLAPALAPTNGTINDIPFIFKVTGSYDQIKVLFDNMNQSIRPINVTGLKLSGASNAMTADVQAITYYATPATTDLKQKEIKP
ncbi:MAG: hypothetical protein ABIQ64_00395 [Candidatus Saccharimonadales bacterium]